MVGWLESRWVYGPGLQVCHEDAGKPQFAWNNTCAWACLAWGFSDFSRWAVSWSIWYIYGPWWSWMLQNRWPCTMLPATKPHTKYWGGPLQPYKFLACFSDHWFWCPQKALPCASLGLMLGAMWGRCGDASPRTLPLCGHLCVLGLAGLRVGSPGWDGYMAHKPRLWAAWCREGVACGL